MYHANDPMRFGSAQVTQSLVAVTDAATELVAVLAAGEQALRVIVQNRGNAAMFVRVGGDASSTGANGEYVLNACTADNDGKGGTLVLHGNAAKITAAIGTGTENASVTKIAF